MKVCATCGSDRCDDAWVCPDCGGRPAILDGFPAFAPELAAEDRGFREAFFASLAAVEADSFWFRARNDLIAWALGTYFAEAGRILEIGCGTGFVLRRMRSVAPAAELSGSEVMSAGLPFAAERVPSATFYQMDAQAIPFRDHFDVIAAFDVLEHIEDDAAVLDEIARALRPGGGLLVSVPQHPALWSAQDTHAHHVRRYTARGLRTRVEAAGFEILHTTSFVTLLLPMMVASRLRMRGREDDATFDAIADLRQPRAVNAVLGAVMGLERRLIERGVSLPAGGSRLLVARKREPAEAAA